MEEEEVGNVFQGQEDMPQARLIPDKEGRKDIHSNQEEGMEVLVELALGKVDVEVVVEEEAVSQKGTHSQVHLDQISYKLTLFSPLLYINKDWFKPSNQRELLL